MHVFQSTLTSFFNDFFVVMSFCSLFQICPFFVHSKEERKNREMRLFIWNDRRWDIVDEKADYDKLNYAVVRKLFIRWLKSVSKF